MTGILLVDKPADWTSHDVVAKLRGITRERRIGHSGTLDPMATGLLVVFLGRATRAVEFAEADEKTYIADLCLGMTTDTQDTTGNTVSTSADIPTRAAVESALQGFLGEVEQIPPMYSAIKRDGKKLYELARKGVEVEREPRRITISRLEILKGENDAYQLNVRCSKGTYIRTLCNDIGASLGCGGTMCSLRRTAAGVFSLENAHTLPEAIAAAERGEGESLLLGVDTLFSGYEAITLNARRERELKSGVRYPTRLEEKIYRAYSESGEFLALVKVEEGKMIMIKNFFEVN